MFRIFISLVLFLIMPATSALALDSQAARQELQRLNIPFTADEFLQRVENGDSQAVELFLDAGMDANLVKDDDSPALAVAIESGHTDIAKELLAHGADPNFKGAGDYAFSPLFAAVAEGQAEIVRLLIKKGAQVNETGPIGLTPLMFAVLGDSLDVVKILVENGADVNSVDIDGDGVLLHALFAEAPNVEIFKFLLAHGADADKKFDDKPLLHVAVFMGLTDIADLLIQNGADINAQDEDGTTALMAAAQAGSNHAIQLLLEKQADPNLKNSFGETAFSLAASSGHPETALILRNVTARDSTDGQMSPLMMAAIEGDIIKTRGLLSEGADPNARDETGRMALYYAVVNRRRDVAEALIDKGADVNASESSGETTLMAAVGNEDLDMVELLLRSGADVNATTDCGATAISRTMFSDSDEILKRLIEHGADITINKSILTSPIMMGDINKVKILIDAGADVNSEDEEGQTPLSIAKEGDEPEIVQLLISAGAKE